MEKNKQLSCTGEAIDMYELMNVKGGAGSEDIVCPVFSSAVKCAVEGSGVFVCSVQGSGVVPPKDPNPGEKF